MTHKSIKLLALAVIFGCSLIAFAVAPSGADIRPLVILTVAVGAGIWFLIYWLLPEGDQK